MSLLALSMKTSPARYHFLGVYKSDRIIVQNQRPKFFNFNFNFFQFGIPNLESTDILADKNGDQYIVSSFVAWEQLLVIESYKKYNAHHFYWSKSHHTSNYALTSWKKLKLKLINFGLNLDLNNDPRFTEDKLRLRIPKIIPRVRSFDAMFTYDFSLWAPSMYPLIKLI